MRGQRQELFTKRPGFYQDAASHYQDDSNLYTHSAFMQFVSLLQNVPIISSDYCDRVMTDNTTM